MTEPLIHRRTKRGLELAATGRHHAIALIGPYGAGKAYLARWLADTILGGRAQPGSIKLVRPDAGSLGIDQIREITRFLKLKTTGRDATRRIVIIEDAHTLTIEAQNALLKTLEEPPHDTRIILTIVGRKTLLSTIYSRLSVVDVLPVSEDQFYSYIGHRNDETQAKRAFAISGGLAGLGLVMLNGDREHELSVAIAEAKQLLTKPAYERLLEADRLAKNKDEATTLLFALKRILSAGLSKIDNSTADRIVRTLKIVHEAESSLPRNPNMKLVLTHVMISL